MKSAFPEGYYLGATVSETVARPCQLRCEYLKQRSDKMYSICKMPQNLVYDFIS